MTKPSVAMIGVGLMGHGIARNIVGKGWPLAYLAHPGNQPTDDLDAAGASRRDSVADLVATADVVVLCVTGSAQVEAILGGADGVIAHIAPGTVVVDCSTAIPSSTERLAAEVAAAGGRFVDAAMTRTPKEAEEGRLNLLIGGDPSTVDEIMPLLRAFSENQFYAGPAGSGHKLKLLHNYVSLGTVTLIGEAAACAATVGIAPDVFVDCLRRGGGYGAALDRTAPFILDRETAQMRFTVANALKDLTYYGRMAAEAEAARSIAEGVRAALASLDEHGFGDRMVPEQAALFRK